MDRLLLIAEIRKRPALWDFQSGEHKSRICVPDMWKDVANAMGPDVTVEECKRKWKNLRDAYRAEVKRIEQRIERDLLKGSYDTRTDYASKWTYFEPMKFINDIKRPRRRKTYENANSSSNDNDNDDNDSDQYSQFHNMDNVKLEPDIEMDAESFTLEDGDADNDNEHDKDNDNDMCAEQLLKETQKMQQALLQNSAQSALPLRLNFSEQNSSHNKKQSDESSSTNTTNCKCPKRSFDQVHFLEDLEKEEQKLMKSTRLDITRSNDLAHVGDSDYNFLVSFLPQMKKMSELQNLQFRAKMSELMLNIMSPPSMSANTSSVSSTLGLGGNSNNYS